MKKKSPAKSASKSSKSKGKHAKPAPKSVAKKAAAKKPAPAKAARGKAPQGKAQGKAAQGKAGKQAAGKNAGKGAAKGAAKNGKAAAGAAAAKKPARVRVRVCKHEGCTNPQTTQGYCRLHYLANWKALREEKLKRAQKNLDRYVERMAGAKKPSPEEGEESEGGAQEKGDAVFEEDFGEFVDVLSREENLDKILNGIKVEDY